MMDAATTANIVDARTMGQAICVASFVVLVVPGAS